MPPGLRPTISISAFGLLSIRSSFLGPRLQLRTIVLVIPVTTIAMFPLELKTRSLAILEPRKLLIIHDLFVYKAGK